MRALLACIPTFRFQPALLVGLDVRSVVAILLRLRFMIILVPFLYELCS